MAIFGGIDDFESYGTGAIATDNGGSGWSGAWADGAAFDNAGTSIRNVTSATVYSGTRGLQVAGDASNDSGTQRTFVASVTGSVYFAWRVDGTSTASGGRFAIYTGSTLITNVYMGYSTGGHPGAYIDASVQIGSDISTNTWYVLNLEWDVVGQPNKVRARLYQSSAWSSFTSWTTVTSFLTVDSLSFGNSLSTRVPNVYYDVVQPTDPTIVASGPANVKTRNGLTQSTGVKTYGALALASVKTFDGIA